MRISGKFLNSKISQQIALILFLAAFIPTALVTGLTYQSIDGLAKAHSHKQLVDTSHNYALAAFSHLTFASAKLIDLSETLKLTSAHPDKLEILKRPIFRSLKLISPDGKVWDLAGHAGYSSHKLKKLIQDQASAAVTNTTQLLLLPATDHTALPVITLVLPLQHVSRQSKLLIGEISPDFLWGDKSDYPSDISVCAYRIDRNTKTRLYCSIPESSAEKSDVLPENIGEWELFLNATFHDNPWTFETRRQYSITGENSGSFIGSNAYIVVALASLLLVALLSLMQIRRTMIPLEQLIKGTRSISTGDFSPVKVDSRNEFGELAEAFNAMSTHIKRQLDTLQALSEIDQEIVSRLDVDHLIRQIIARIQQIMPAGFICVTRLNGKDNLEAQCSMIVSANTCMVTPRIAIPSKEIKIIGTYGRGRFCHCMNDSRFVHENLLAESGAKHCWILPIFWQGEMCAFLSIGNEDSLQPDDPDWDEIRELASRIGIAISAQEREDRLLVQAQYDNLTGLPNRILLQDRLRQAMEYSDRSSDPFWVAFIDLDRFKFINDTLGHKIGDTFLIEISRRLQQAIRDTDTVARFGGDEFILILQGQMDADLRISVLHRLIQAVSTTVTIEGNEILTTCSVGVSVYPADGSSPDILLRNADIAMYRAKELGRNNLQFFTQAMNEELTDRLRMETHLRKALELNEFTLFYQQKVNISTNQIVGVEALIRWDSKELGFISPQHFIPLAEETGLIIPIGEWVLKTACAQAVAWQKAGFTKLLMSVNLSARQLRQKNLLESIAGILRESGLDAGNLELELTESVIMNEFERSNNILQDIKSLGIGLAIDDFGTGYSSLSYLKNLPVDTLKIDKSFIDDIVLRSDEVPIVASVIALAKNLKLKVVAEGVETYEQVMYLAAHGCNEIQGYYFGRPEPAATITTLLRIK
jgi:diguanylate cyclase (GGDEF)-like protein